MKWFLLIAIMFVMPACNSEKQQALARYDSAKSCFVSTWSMSASARFLNPSDKQSSEESAAVGMRYMDHGVSVGKSLSKTESDVRREFLEAGLRRMESFGKMEGEVIRSELIADVRRTQDCSEEFKIFNK